MELLRCTDLKKVVPARGTPPVCALNGIDLMRGARGPFCLARGWGASARENLQQMPYAGRGGQPHRPGRLLIAV